MIECIRCSRPTQRDDMQPGRSHCRKCQRRANRLAYYRHRFAALEKVSRRRAEQYMCPTIAADVDYACIYAEEIGHPCYRCDEPVMPENYEFDHVYPLALGGAHARYNIRLVHRYCNRAASMRQFILSAVLTRKV